jgi:Mg-chelatase subunit ChlI
MQFIMIGSGNPQEGELRPQLLDRFGLSVNVATLQDTDTRVELVISRMQYEEVCALLGVVLWSMVLEQVVQIARER